MYSFQIFIYYRPVAESCRIERRPQYSGAHQRERLCVPGSAVSQLTSPVTETTPDSCQGPLQHMLKLIRQNGKFYVLPAQKGHHNLRI